MGILYARESPLTGAVELMDDVLDSQEKDGLRPLKLNRLRRSERLTLLLLWPPMLVCESDMATRPSSPRMLASSAPHGGVGGGLPAAASVWIRSSGVIGGSDMVPAGKIKQWIIDRRPSIKRPINQVISIYWTAGNKSTNRKKEKTTN